MSLMIETLLYWFRVLVTAIYFATGVGQEEETLDCDGTFIFQLSRLSRPPLFPLSFHVSWDCPFMFGFARKCLMVKYYFVLVVQERLVAKSVNADIRQQHNM